MNCINKNPEILIIDDTPEHVHFVASIIRTRNYRVRVVTSALLAFDALKRGVPDLILLDVIMPEKDGFELCSLIKKDPRYQSVPIIFLTAVKDGENIIKGFEAGAQDYVSKPVNANELLVRIQTHLSLKKRTDKLLEAHNEIDSFNHMISHDLKTPVRSIKKLTDFLKEAVRDRNEGNINELLDLLTEKASETVGLIEKYAQLAKLSRTALNIESVSMNNLASRAFKELKKAFPGQKMLFEKNELPVVQGDSLLLGQVLINLFSNAAKYSRGRDKSIIRMSCTKIDYEYMFSIKDNGVGFDMKYAQNIFNLFVRLHAQSEFEGTGTGLAIVKKIINLHGGRVWITAAVDRGTEACFTLPVEVEVGNLFG